MATARSPAFPDFAGLGVIGDGATQADGSSRVPKFRSWVSERQMERANILKQTRLYAEERWQRKGKGKGRPYRPYRSGLSLKDRRKKLAELKSKPFCKGFMEDFCKV